MFQSSGGRQLLRTYFGNILHKGSPTSTRRWMTSALDAAINSKTRILPMPKLSPTMTHGTIKKWHVIAGSPLEPYQLIVEIATTSLTMESTEAKEEDIMEVEILEDMFLVDIIGKEGDTFVPGKPIAILCDDLDDMQVVEALKVSILYVQLFLVVTHLCQ